MAELKKLLDDLESLGINLTIHGHLLEAQAIRDAIDWITKEETGVVSIVRCKDCEHLIRHSGFMDDGYCKHIWKRYGVRIKPREGWFCADGKRKLTKGQ